MRLRIHNPLLVRFLSLLCSWLLKAWMKTLDIWVESEQENLPGWRPRPAIYVCWHETVLLTTGTHIGDRVGILISTHRDGDVIAWIMEFLGGRAFRGSSTRDGARALRSMVQSAEGWNVAITPDGPRGPRRQLQMGAIFLASKTGMPIIPVGLAARNAWHIRNWDRTSMPRPFSAARVVYGQPIAIPEDLRRQQMEEYRLQVEQALNQTQERAEDLASRQVTRSLRPLRQTQRRLR